MLRIKITSHVNLGKSLLRNHASGWGMDRNCGANVKYAIHPYINREVDRNYGANAKHAIILISIGKGTGTVVLTLNMPYILISTGMGTEGQDMGIYL